jgi:hypothetical protein
VEQETPFFPCDDSPVAKRGDKLISRVRYNPTKEMKCAMRRFCLHRNLVILLVLCISIGFCTSPCLAGYKYISGGPDLFATLESSDELIPGTTVELPLVIENTGVLTMEFYSPYTMQPEYLPTTALFATAELNPGDAPVKVKSNPLIVGDIASGMVVPATFIVEIPQNTTAGTYTMHAVVTYQYVPRVEQDAIGSIEYNFKDAEDTLPIPVTIRKVVVLSVENVSSSHLQAGGEGYVTFTIRNTGQDTGERTSVYVVPEGASPVVPFTNGVYIGTLPPGGIAQPRFKVAISRNADPGQTYPVTLYAEYRDFEGNTITSPSVSTGIKFGEEVRFERTSPPAVLYPGKTDTVSVTYQNTGNSTVYNAKARINVIDPFSSDDDTAYLGDMRPLESATALFRVKTDGGATVKTYSVDSEIGYTDAFNTAFTSDNIPVVIDVHQDSGTSIAAIVLVLAVIGGAAFLWYRKKKAADAT